MSDLTAAPRLKDSKQARHPPIYPLNCFPDDLIKRIGSYMIYLIHTGRKDISGDDWGDAFADALGGKHLASPVGIADVEYGNYCWSMKTVKYSKPFVQRTLSLISGRCSPDYSYNIYDPHKDPQRTGEAVLNIWNERINIAHDKYSSVRTSILVRSSDMLSYNLFEEEAVRYRINDYIWKFNSNGILEGYDENDIKRFRWQPHGAQFTIYTDVPAAATRFKVRKPDIITKEISMEMLHYTDDWVTIIR